MAQSNATPNTPPSPTPPGDWTAATKHLCRIEPRFKAFADRAGPCDLRPRRDYFSALCQSIISQQISTAAARTVGTKFRGLFPKNVPTPGLLAALDVETLRAVGIGPQRQTYLRALATAHLDGTLPTRGWAKMSDDAVIERLTAVRGIGRWTAEMFLMFVLARPDVLPIDDLGLQMGAAKLIGHPEKKLSPKAITQLAEPWRPWRSVATWYLWRGSPPPPGKS